MAGSPIQKYRLGLIVLGLFTLGLLVFVLMQAGSAKQDNKTYQQATSIANKLNNYVNTNLTLPSNLAGAGINNVPSTISYKKINYTKYRFCVEYKGSSSSFNAAEAESQLLAAASSGAYGSGNSGGGSSSSFDLYISSYHKSGENCQTVNAQLNNNSYGSGGGGGSGGGSGSDPYAKCYSIVDNNAYQQCITNVANSQGSQTN